MLEEKNIAKPSVDEPADRYQTSPLSRADEFAGPVGYAPDSMTTQHQNAAKKKGRKRDRHDRLTAAIINSLGRIFAQVIGALVGVVLGVVIAGQVTGSKHGDQGKPPVPELQPELQRLGGPLGYEGQLQEPSQVIFIDSDAPHTIRQPFVDRRDLLIITKGKGRFILHFEPARPPQ